MALSPVQVAQTEHVLTATDVASGFSTVHITWPEPFSDTEYTTTFGVHDKNAFVDLSFVTGDMHNVATDGFDAVVYFASALPLVQGQLDKSNVNTVQSLSLTATSSTLYMITLYMASRGDGLSTDKVEWEITYTDESGTPQTFVDSFAPIVGSGGSPFVSSSQNSSFPVFGTVGTPITVATIFAGTANPFHYDISIRIVQMPNNASVAQVGDMFVVNAVGIHN